MRSFLIGTDDAHHAKVEKDKRAIFGAHQQIAGVRVGVKQAVLKELGEIGPNAVAQQLQDVDAGCFQRLHVGDLDAVDKLGGQNPPAARIPSRRAGASDARQPLEVGPETLGQVRFVDIVQFFKQLGPKLVYEADPLLVAAEARDSVR